jgi:Skp family chaperone for outer membrane proteins
MTALVLGASVAPVAAQQLKAPVIAVVNYAAAIRKSAAGESLREQMDKQRAVYQTEIKAIQTKLEQARAELGKQQAVLAPEIFARKRQEYQQQAEELQRTAQNRKRQLDQMQAKGISEIDKALRLVLEGVAKDRGIDIILNGDPRGGAIVLAGKDFFITEDAVKRLNEKLPKVTIAPALE